MPDAVPCLVNTKARPIWKMPRKAMIDQLVTVHGLFNIKGMPECQ